MCMHCFTCRRAAVSRQEEAATGCARGCRAHACKAVMLWCMAFVAACASWLCAVDAPHTVSMLHWERPGIRASCRAELEAWLNGHVAGLNWKPG